MRRQASGTVVQNGNAISLLAGRMYQAFLKLRTVVPTACCLCLALRRRPSKSDPLLASSASPEANRRLWVPRINQGASKTGPAFPSLSTSRHPLNAGTGSRRESVYLLLVLPLLAGYRIEICFAPSRFVFKA